MTEGNAQVSILQTAPIPASEPGKPDQHFKIHKLWSAPSADALVAEAGPSIRGLAAGGSLRIDGSLMDRLPKLEIIANFGVGYDRIDVDAAHARKIIVTNTPDVLTDEVADLTLGLLIATVRKLPQADRYLREGHWLKAAYPLTASLRGRKVGIVGLGRIGKAIAKRCEAFGLEIAYNGRTEQKGSGYRFVPTVLELARQSDVLIVVTPGSPDTQNLIDAAVLDALGPQGILINVARGSVVDEPALIQALKEGRILAAGLDVFADEPRVPAELIALDNVVLLPHVGSASVVTRNAMGDLVWDNLKSWFAGKGPLTPVAETPWPQA
jgi:lactate dehydrogenase-like 2-hydroxyacid dehydrogenase